MSSSEYASGRPGGRLTYHASALWYFRADPRGLDCSVSVYAALFDLNRRAAQRNQRRGFLRSFGLLHLKVLSFDHDQNPLIIFTLTQWLDFFDNNFTATDKRSIWKMYPTRSYVLYRIILLVLTSVLPWSISFFSLHWVSACFKEMWLSTSYVVNQAVLSGTSGRGTGFRNFRLLEHKATGLKTSLDDSRPIERRPWEYLLRNAKETGDVFGWVRSYLRKGWQEAVHHETVPDVPSATRQRQCCLKKTKKKEKEKNQKSKMTFIKCMHVYLCTFLQLQSPIYILQLQSTAAD